MNKFKELLFLKNIKGVGNAKINNEEGIVTSNDIIKSLEVAAKTQSFSLREMVTISVFEDDSEQLPKMHKSMSINL